MNKPVKFDEFDFLDLFFKKMLEKGHAFNLIRLSVNAGMVDDIYDKSTIILTESHLQKMADTCIANNWVEQVAMGTKYGSLQLTSTGLGVVKSKRMQKELLKKRTTLKKISDYIENHKGLFIFLGFIVALVGLLIKILRE